MVCVERVEENIEELREKIMTFEKFVENMKNNIKNYLPEDYQDAEILIRKVQNINRTYTGLNVHKKGFNRYILECKFVYGTLPVILSGF